jgi:ferritin
VTSLRINTAEFKHVCKNVRAEIPSMFKSDEESIYTFYRWFVRDQEAKILRAATNPADDLRAELNVASRAAMQYGATPSQINYIVSLATKNNDFRVMSGGCLSKTEASRIIDVMKNGLN